MAKDGWEFWKVTTASGELAWLALTRPGSRAVIDRQKVWTLVPKLRVFIANWFVTDDFLRQDGPWAYENIDADEARDLVGDVPNPTAEDLRRITRPERVLTLDESSRGPSPRVGGLCGARAAGGYSSKM
ncbi:hypothetical protein [Mycolicibacter algericus]|uniref:hypothetical protein n=1 Tax=Mycolicibacter algericus TaxID=1288388 RepID=UPI003C76EBBA